MVDPDLVVLGLVDLDADALPPDLADDLGLVVLGLPFGFGAEPPFAPPDPFFLLLIASPMKLYDAMSSCPMAWVSTFATVWS